MTEYTLHYGGDAMAISAEVAAEMVEAIAKVAKDGSPSLVRIDGNGRADMLLISPSVAVRVSGPPGSFQGR